MKLNVFYMNPDIEVGLSKPFQTYGSFSIVFQ